MPEVITEELKALVTEQQKTVKEMRDALDEKVKLAVKGQMDVLLEGKLKNMSDSLDKLESTAKALRDLEIAFKRVQQDAGGDGKSPVRIASHNRVKRAHEMWLRRGEGSDHEGKFSPRACKALAQAMEEQKAYRTEMETKGDDGEVADVQKKSMSVISDPDGGFLTLTDFNGKVIERIFETSPVRNVADSVSISTHEISGINDTDEMDAGWVGETGARPATTTAQVGQWTIPVFELYAAPQFSQQLFDDANINVEDWASKKIANKIGRLENIAFVLGNGVSKPRGFMTYASAAPNGAGLQANDTVEQVVSGAAATFTYLGLVALQTALKTAYRANATWMGSRVAIGAIRQLVDSFGRPLWGEANLLTGQPASLLGMPFQEFNDMASPGANALALALGDMKQAYMIVDRIGLRILRDPYTSKPFVIMYTTKRTGGKVLNFEAIKIQKCST